MTKRRILFVDDEAKVLDGLRNLLRRQRHEWDMLFALSGAAALEELAKAPVDVIVSDMRMPGMDGAELLTRVRTLYPQTARIVLSGHAERGAILEKHRDVPGAREEQKKWQTHFCRSFTTNCTGRRIATCAGKDKITRCRLQH